MSKMSEEARKKQESLDLARAYIANDIRVTREVFIKELAYALYMDVEVNGGDQYTLTMRSTINEFIKDESADTMVIDGRMFSSYIEEDLEELAIVFPRKLYTVSYDINIVPLIIAKVKRAMKWKRMTTFVEATSFKEAKVLFKEQFKKDHPDRKCKMIYVELSTNVDDDAKPADEVKSNEKITT